MGNAASTWPDGWGIIRAKDCWLKVDELTDGPLILEFYLSQHGLT